MSDFFSVLRRKLERRPGRDFDSGFWEKFDEEFAAPRVPWWRLGIPAAALGAAVIVLTLTLNRPDSTKMTVAEMIENADALKDKDMALLLTPSARELVDLSDDEWKRLLRGESG